MAATNTNCLNVSDETTASPALNLVIQIVVLGSIDLAVVLGNSLVIAAVLTTRKLRTVTNIFIVSLACADLLLGFAVLPFSISLEVVDIWLWGPIWCNMWLAIDVWLCTASILSLCAISLDRYIAVTHPIRYPSLMSPYRGRVLVSVVWILSFVICLPPLLGWNDGGEKTIHDIKDNALSQNPSTLNRVNLVDSPAGVPEDLLFNLTAAFDDYSGMFSNISVFMNSSDQCVMESLTCELTPTPGYRIYAAMGSFFIPMLVMVFFYFRIYLTAVRTAASLRKGVLTTRSSNELSHSRGYADEEIHLRVHRGGGGSSNFRYSSGQNYEYHPTSQRKVNNGSRSPNLTETNGKVLLIPKDDLSQRKNNANSTKWSRNTNNILKQIGDHFKHSKEKRSRETSEEDSTEMDTLNTDKKKITDIMSNSLRITNESPNISPTNSLIDKRSPRRIRLLVQEGKSVSLKGHARKFRRETKAAKTLAIIVGAFIVCWCPFFTIYLLGAFCQGCVGEIVFAVFFWLGYCNSALNPCIYALFARDFRFAFKRLLSCKRRKGFTQAARADYVTGVARHRTTVIVHENDSASDY